MRLPGEYTEVAIPQVLPHPGTSLSLQPNPHLCLEASYAGNHMGNPESTGSLRLGTYCSLPR